MKKLTTFVLFMAVVLTWGTTWLAMQVAVNTIPPLFATGMRFLFASPLLLLLCKLSKAPLLFSKEDRKYQIIVTAFYFTIPFSLMIYGEKYVSSAIASIIFSTMPAMVLITSALFINKKTNCMQVLGLATATLALGALIIKNANMTNPSGWRGIAALLIAVALHAIIYTQTKKRGERNSVLSFNAVPCLISGFLLTAVGWVFEKPDLHHISTVSFLATLYLGAFAGVFGVLFYFYLQQRTAPFKASLVFLLFPIVAITLDWYFFGQALCSDSGIILIPLFLGVILTTYFDNESLKKS